jgi:hypothetical protein
LLSAYINCLESDVTDYEKRVKNKMEMMSRLVDLVVLLDKLEGCGAEILTS